MQPTRPAAGRQPRAEATRQRILDETVACILEEGYAAASAKHIADRAGVTWGVVQYHFGDRRGILAAVIETGLAEFVTAMESVSVPDGPLRARLEAIVEAGHEAFTSRLSLASFEILLATRSSADDPLSGKAATYSRQVARLGAMAAPRHDPIVSRVLLTGFRGIALLNLVTAVDIDTSKERAALVDVLLAYLQTTEVPPAG